MLDLEFSEGRLCDSKSCPYVSSTQHIFVEEMNDEFESLLMSRHHLIFRVLFANMLLFNIIFHLF